MRSHRILLAAALAAVALLPGQTAALDEPGQDRHGGGTIRLQGAFGVVTGGLASAPATAYPGEPLDAWLRAAPMQLTLHDAPEGATVTSVIARHLARGTEAPLELATDGLLTGPSEVGESVLIATLSTPEGVESEHAWLLDVPDRSGGLDELVRIRPPVILLTSEAGEVSGPAGNSCYAYLCDDVGGLPAVESIAALKVGVGETPGARAIDGSGLVGWTGRLRPADMLYDVPIEGSGAAPDSAGTLLALTGMEPPRPGAWLLELRVDFDRERGYAWHAYRLVTE